PEALPSRLLEALQVRGDLFLETSRERAAVAHVLDGGRGRDREAGGYGNPDCGHLGEAGALAAEELAAQIGSFREVVNEVLHVVETDFPTPGQSSTSLRTDLTRGKNETTLENHAWTPSNPGCLRRTRRSRARVRPRDRLLRRP